MIGAPSTSIRKPMIDTFVIVILSLAEQERIVSVLDKFAMAMDSITECLPMAVVLRRKQYPYHYAFLAID